MDEHLTWKFHITELCKKLSKTVGIFFKVRHYALLPTLASLYNSLFLSFLSYGILVWGVTFESYLNPLLNLQKKVLRSIKFQPLSSPSTQIFQSLKVLKIWDILYLKILTFVYKSVNKLSPSCFHDYFTLTSSVHRTGTRQATRVDIFMSTINTTLYGLKTIQHFGVKLWNTIPLYIRVASSTKSFCSKLKSYFLDLYSLC